MFDHTCTACEERFLIFPSQIVDVTSTDHGILTTFACWCGAEQTALSGRRARPVVPRPTGARAA